MRLSHFFRREPAAGIVGRQPAVDVSSDQPQRSHTAAFSLSCCQVTTERGREPERGQFCSVRDFHSGQPLLEFGLAETFSESYVSETPPTQSFFLSFFSWVPRVCGGLRLSLPISVPFRLYLSQVFPPVISYISNSVLTSAFRRT